MVYTIVDVYCLFHRTPFRVRSARVDFNISYANITLTEKVLLLYQTRSYIVYYTLQLSPADKVDSRRYTGKRLKKLFVKRSQ